MNDPYMEAIAAGCYPLGDDPQIDPIVRIIKKLRLLDDKQARPVTVLEREICGETADLLENLYANR